MNILFRLGISFCTLFRYNNYIWKKQEGKGNMLKRLFSLLMVLMLVVTLSACNLNVDKGSDQTEDPVVDNGNGDQDNDDDQTEVPVVVEANIDQVLTTLSGYNGFDLLPASMTNDEMITLFNSLEYTDLEDLYNDLYNYFLDYGYLMNGGNDDSEIVVSSLSTTSDEFADDTGSVSPPSTPNVYAEDLSAIKSNLFMTNDYVDLEYPADPSSYFYYRIALTNAIIMMVYDLAESFNQHAEFNLDGNVVTLNTSDLVSTEDLPTDISGYEVIKVKGTKVNDETIITFMISVEGLTEDEGITETGTSDLYIKLVSKENANEQIESSIYFYSETTGVYTEVLDETNTLTENYQLNLNMSIDFIQGQLLRTINHFEYDVDVENLPVELTTASFKEVFEVSVGSEETSIKYSTESDITDSERLDMVIVDDGTFGHLFLVNEVSNEELLGTTVPEQHVRLLLTYNQSNELVFMGGNFDINVESCTDLEGSCTSVEYDQYQYAGYAFDLSQFTGWTELRYAPIEELYEIYNGDTSIFTILDYIVTFDETTGMPTEMNMVMPHTDVTSDTSYAFYLHGKEGSDLQITLPEELTLTGLDSIITQYNSLETFDQGIDFTSDVYTIPNIVYSEYASTDISE